MPNPYFSPAIRLPTLSPAGENYGTPTPPRPVVPGFTPNTPSLPSLPDRTSIPPKTDPNYAITYNERTGSMTEPPPGFNWIPDSWETGPDAGRIWNPIPMPGTTDATAYRTRQIPGAEYKKYVDYTSLAWQKARQITFSDPYSKSAWGVIPDAWKVDLAGWEPETREAWVMGFVRGDDAMMQSAQKQQQSYGRQVAQQQKAEQRAGHAPAPSAVSPYYTGSPWL